MPYNEAITSDHAMRASDRDREVAAERLRHAAGEGRLLPEELEQRLHAALIARTYGELAAIVRDLPAPRTLSAPRRVTRVRPRRVLLWLAALFALLFVLMAAGAGMHGRVSVAAPIPPPPAAPTPPAAPPPPP